MTLPERRSQADRRRASRGGRRPYDRSGSYPPLLIAESYEGARLPAVRFLKRFNFDVAEATNGEEALQRIVASPPHVILADSSLPAMPAPRLCQWLEQSWRTRSIPVIVMTGDYLSDEPIPPAAGVLVKPFPLSTMLDEIRRVIRLWTS
jgi:CheY-like chemotaxis protein